MADPVVSNVTIDDQHRLVVEFDNGDQEVLPLRVPEAFISVGLDNNKLIFADADNNPTTITLPTITGAVISSFGVKGAALVIEDTAGHLHSVLLEDLFPFDFQRLESRVSVLEGQYDDQVINDASIAGRDITLTRIDGSTIPIALPDDPKGISNLKLINGDTTLQITTEGGDTLEVVLPAGTGNPIVAIARVGDDLRLTFKDGTTADVSIAQTDSTNPVTSVVKNGDDLRIAYKDGTTSTIDLTQTAPIVLRSVSLTGDDLVYTFSDGSQTTINLAGVGTTAGNPIDSLSITGQTLTATFRDGTTSDIDLPLDDYAPTRLELDNQGQDGLLEVTITRRDNTVLQAAMQVVSTSVVKGIRVINDELEVTDIAGNIVTHNLPRLIIDSGGGGGGGSGISQVHSDATLSGTGTAGDELRVTDPYSQTEKTKLAGIEAGAEVNVKSDWNATSGDAEILNKPTVPSSFAPTNAEANVQSDWAQSDDQADDYIKNKPAGVTPRTDAEIDARIDAKVDEPYRDASPTEIPHEKIPLAGTNHRGGISVALYNKLISIEDGATADLTADEIRNLLEGLAEGSQLSYNALDDNPVTISQSQTNRLQELWIVAPKETAIIWHGEFRTGHFASTWQGYNKSTGSDGDLSSAGVLGSVVYNPDIDLATITSNKTGTASVVTVVNSGNRRLYFGIQPDDEHDAVWIPGVRLAITYNNVKVFDKALTDFEVADQGTIRVTENDLLSNQFRNRPDDSQFDVFLYKKGDNSESTLDDLQSGNVIAALKNAPVAWGEDRSMKQGLTEDAINTFVDNKADIRADKLDGFDASGAVEAAKIPIRVQGGHLVIPLTPTQSNVAVSKEYVDGLIQYQQTAKAACRFGTTAALSASYGSNQTITSTANGSINDETAIDTGVLNIAVGDRILVLHQGSAVDTAGLGTNNRENGIYRVTQVGTASTQWEMQRDHDFNSGALVFVAHGTTLARSLWVMLTHGTIVLDTTSLQFTQIGAVNPQQITVDEMLADSPNPVRNSAIHIEIGALQVKDANQDVIIRSKLSAVAHDATLVGSGTTGSPLKVANEFTADDESKLDGIEANATKDQTAPEIRDALQTLQLEERLDASAIKGIPEPADGGLASVSSDSTLTGSGTSDSPMGVANPFTDADETKLDGIEANATADQTAPEIKSALEGLSGDNRLDADAVKDALQSVATDSTLDGDGTASDELSISDEYTRSVLERTIKKANCKATSAGCIASTQFPNPNVFDPTEQTITAGADGSINDYTRLSANGSVSYSIGDRILLLSECDSTLLAVGDTSNPTSHIRNGIYEVTDLGSASTRWIIKRTADFNQSTDFQNGAEVYVLEGRNANTSWILATSGSITLGSTALRFARKIDSSSSGGGLTSVASDSTLTGDGTGTDPLKVASPFTAAEKTKLASLTNQSGLTQVESDATLTGHGTTASPLKVANEFTHDDETKLDGIENNATADQTGTEIVASIDTTLGQTTWKQGGGGGGGLASVSSDATLTGDGTSSDVLKVANPFTDADETKLDGIEANAKDDQTAAEIKTAYESNDDTNAYTDAEKTKLGGIEDNAKDDQTGAEIVASIDNELGSETWQQGGGGAGGISAVISDDTLTGDGAASATRLGVANPFTDEDEAKLDGIEANAKDDQTGTEIVASIDTELGQTDWKQGGGGGTPIIVKASVKCALISELVNAQYQVTHTRIESTDNRALPTTSDGVTLVAGDRVLYLASNHSGTLGASATQSSNHHYNGIYVITQLGSASSPYILTRAADMNSDADIASGLLVYIDQGTNFGKTQWSLAGGSLTLDTSNLLFKRAQDKEGSGGGDGSDVLISANNPDISNANPPLTPFPAKDILIANGTSQGFGTGLYSRAKDADADTAWDLEGYFNMTTQLDGHLAALSKGGSASSTGIETLVEHTMSTGTNPSFTAGNIATMPSDFNLSRALAEADDDKFMYFEVMLGKSSSDRTGIRTIFLIKASRWREGTAISAGAITTYSTDACVFNHQVSPNPSSWLRGFTLAKTGDQSIGFGAVNGGSTYIVGVNCYLVTFGAAGDANVQANWTETDDTADGYIQNKPTIPAAQVQSDWDATTGLGAILNKPTIPAAQVQSDWDATSGLGAILNKPDVVSASEIDAKVTGDQLQNGYYFPPDRSGRLISVSDADAHLYEFGMSSFSITMVINVNFDRNTSSGQEFNEINETLFSTIKNHSVNQSGEQLYTKGIWIALSSHRISGDRFRVVFNDTDGKFISGSGDESPSFSATSSVFGELNNTSCLVTLVVDRANANIKLYCNDKLEIDTALPDTLGDISGRGIYLGHIHNQNLDQIHASSFPLADATIHNLVIWNKVLNDSERQILIRNKNYPTPTDQYAHDTYTSDFTSTADGWTGINADVTRLDSDVLQLKVGTLINIRKSAVSGNILIPNSVYELEFSYGKVTGQADNNEANGFNIYAGGITETTYNPTTHHDPALGNRIVSLTNIPTTQDTPFKTHKVTFRSTTDSADSSNNIPIRILLTHNGAEVFEDAGQNDSYEFKDFKVRRIGAVEHWSSSSPTDLIWTPDYNKKNVIDNHGALPFIKKPGNEIIVPLDDIKFRLSDEQDHQFSYSRREMFIQIEGKIAHIQARITMTIIPTAPNLQDLQIYIAGLPIPSKTRGSTDAVLSVIAKGISSTLRANDVMATIPSGQDKIWLHKTTNGGYSHLTLTDITNTMDLIISGSYAID